MPADCRFFTIKSPTFFKTQLTNDGADFPWDSVPMGIVMFCEPMRQLLLETGSIATSTPWESFIEIKESEWRPTKRIKINEQTVEDVPAALHVFLSVLKGEEPTPDLFSNALRSLEAFTRIKDLATETQSNMKGKILSIPVRFCLNEQELEISGKINRPLRKTEESKEKRSEILAYIDAPSTWNRTVLVQSTEGSEKMTLNIDARNFLEILHVAQIEQRPCKISTLETVDAKLNKIKTVEHIQLMAHTLDL